MKGSHRQFKHATKLGRVTIVRRIRRRPRVAHERVGTTHRGRLGRA